MLCSRRQLCTKPFGVSTGATGCNPCYGGIFEVFIRDEGACGLIPHYSTGRELSLGLVRPIDVFRVWVKEASVGAINGIVLGLLIGVVAWVWMDNSALGFVIGAALAINTVIAVSIGGVVPLIVKRLGQDPAAASGPLLTTITDIAGFFLVLSIATLMMPALVS